MACSSASRLMAVLLLLAAAHGALAQGDAPPATKPDESTTRQDEARNPRLALSAADAERIRGIVVVSAIPQDDVRKQTERFIRTTVNSVRPTGAGLIGAIIGAVIADAIVNSQTQSRIERAALALPIIMEQAKDLDFRQEFWQRLGERLDTESRFEIADETHLKTERGHVEIPERVQNVPVVARIESRAAP